MQDYEDSRGDGGLVVAAVTVLVVTALVAAVLVLLAVLAS